MALDPDIQVADCICTAEPYKDGTKPFFTKDRNAALRMFLGSVTKLFFGVHLDGAHITAVRHDGVWYGGLNGRPAPFGY